MTTLDITYQGHIDSEWIILCKYLQEFDNFIICADLQFGSTLMTMSDSIVSIK